MTNTQDIDLQFNVDTINSKFENMSKVELIDFLVDQYGNQIGEKQHLKNTDYGIIKTQLDLVDKDIGNSNLGGILWPILGMIWLILGYISFYNGEFDMFKFGYIIFGFLKIMMGFFYLYRSSELKKKKVILETILFLNLQA